MEEAPDPGDIAGAEKIRYLEVRGDGRREAEGLVAREAAITIVLNGSELITMLCSPFDLKNLAAGYLFSEGLIEAAEDIEGLAVDESRGMVLVETRGRVDAKTPERRLIASGGGRGAFSGSIDHPSVKIRINSGFSLPAANVLALVNDFQHCSDLHRATRGVHSAALCDASRIVMFAEDIGRHNAVDKIVGRCTLMREPAGGHALILSGRISSEMLMKAARRGFPMIVSLATPTSAAVRLAESMGITVVGRVRDAVMNVYSAPSRITA